MKITLQEIRKIIIEEIKKTIEEHEYSSTFVGPTEEIYLFFNTSKDKRSFEDQLDRYVPYDPYDRHCGDDSGTLDKDIVYLSVNLRDKKDNFIDAIRFFSSIRSNQMIKQMKGEKISSKYDRSITQQKFGYLKELDELHASAKNFVMKMNSFISTNLKKKRAKNEKFKLHGMLLKVKCGETIGNFLKYNNIRLNNNN